MSSANQAAMEFLLTRRSRPWKTLGAPVPTPAQLAPILQAATRTPDHGKLEPWRFIVLSGASLTRLGDLAKVRGEALGMEADAVIKAVNSFANASMIVAVISTPKESEKVPRIEQVYSAGAVCLAFLNAALASGWGANWISGWASHDRDFIREGLGLDESESVAGFMHIGTESCTPPERPRPDVDAKTDWIEL